MSFTITCRTVLIGRQKLCGRLLCFAHFCVMHILHYFKCFVKAEKALNFSSVFCWYSPNLFCFHTHILPAPHFLHKSQISTPFSLWFNTSHAHIMHIIHTLCTHPVSVNFEDFQDGLTRVFRKIAKNASNFQVGLSSNPGCGYWTHLLKDMYM